MVVSVTDQFNNNNNTEENKDDELIKEFKRSQISNDSKFQIIPDATKEREIIYVAGPSGSGKSTFTRKYIEELKKKKKDKDVQIRKW